MTDVPSQEPDLDALAASLRLDASDVRVFFPALAARLEASMPGMVTVSREGGLFKKDHPVRKIVVRAGEDVFEAELRGGAVTAHHAHAVRGITLRSEELDLRGWLGALVGVLQARAQTSADATAALRALVT